MKTSEVDISIPVVGLFLASVAVGCLSRAAWGWLTLGAGLVILWVIGILVALFQKD